MKRLAPAILIVVLTLAAALFLGRPPSSPPSLFDGRPVSAWALDLNSPSAATRDAAEKVVRRFSPNAVPELVKMLRTPDPVLARPSRFISRWLPGRARAFIYRSVNPFEASAQRACAAQALRIMGTNAAAALPDLRKALRDDQAAAWHAALALAQLGNPGTTALTTALAETPPPQSAFICYALGTQGMAASNAIPALARLLEKGPPPLAEKAAKALERIGPPAVPSLIQGLTNQNQAARVLAIHALGSLGLLAKESLPKLIETSRTAAPEAREAAVEALSRIRPSAPEVVAALTGALKDPEQPVRLKAVQGLRRVPHAAGNALPALLDLLSDRSPELRGQAAALLGEIGVRRDDAVTALRRRLQDENDFVRNQAREALRQLGEK